jgi:hypothetical protein
MAGNCEVGAAPHIPGGRVVVLLRRTPFSEQASSVTPLLRPATALTGTPTTPDDTDYTCGVDAFASTVQHRLDVVRAAGEADVLETVNGRWPRLRAGSPDAYLHDAGHNRPVPLSMCAGCLETGIYSSVDIPSVAFGPGPTVEMHAPTEHVPIDNLLEAATVYAITLGQQLGSTNARDL